MSYGIQLYGPDGETVVFSENIRTGNVQILESRTLERYNSVETFNCLDAQDSNKILITFKSTPISRYSGFEIYYTRHTNQIKVQMRYLRNGGVVPFEEQDTYFSFTLMAVRIG